MRRNAFGHVTFFVAMLVLCFVGMSVGLAGARLARAADNEARSAASSLTVRIVTPRTPAAIARAAGILETSPGVQSAALVDARRAAQLLETWGGARVNPAEIPQLALIEVRLAAKMQRPDAPRTIGRTLERAGYTAEVYDAAAAALAAGRTARAIRVIAIAALAGLVLAIMLLARAQVGAAPEAATILADLGAPRGHALARYGKLAAEASFLAAFAAACAAAAASLAVQSVIAPSLALADMLRETNDIELFLVFGSPLLASACAALGARSGAARLYDAAERLG